MSRFRSILDEHLDLASRLDLPQLQQQLDRAVALVCEALEGGCPVLVCGNGGSAADAQHIAGELVGKFLIHRQALDVQCLSSNTCVLTAWGNDVSYETVFSRQVEAHGRPGGVLIALSTSGRSRNVLLAAEAARRAGMKVLSLTGEGGADLAALSDLVLAVPSTRTPRIQEYHILFYHYLCECVEERLARGGAAAGKNTAGR